MLSWGAYVLLAPEVRDQFVVVFKFQYLVCIVSINFTITMQCTRARLGELRARACAYLRRLHLHCTAHVGIALGAFSLMIEDG